MTTQAVDFEALAARCEQETGPDRDLDFAIYGGKLPYRTGHIPRFTASLDAAKSLNPGWVWMGVFERPDGSWSAQLGHAQFSDPVYGSAATEELARCAASLRARASEQVAP